jgi:chromosome condensin MukBEF complex kleisin-like MukF subunit
MMETMFSSIDIHEETPLELEKEDDINENGSYIMNTSSNLCSYEKSPKSIDLSIATHEIFNPLILPIHKDFERVVIDAYVYRCVNLEIGTRRLVSEGKPLHQLKAQLEDFPRTSFCPKESTFER